MPTSAAHPHAPADVQHAAPSPHPGQPEAMHLHAPPEHDRPFRHAFVDPHPPQLLRSVCSFTHAPLHPVNPGLHITAHMPLTHVGTAFATDVVHSTPHVPQLSGSVCLLVQVPPQTSGVAPEQLAVQLPPTQTGVLPLHVVLQPPQWLLSVFSSTQPASTPQLVKPASALQV